MTDQFPPDPYDDAQAPKSALTVPHSREAEESTIGCVLISPDAYFEVSELINSNDFYIHKHQWIWDAFVNLTMNKMAIDIMTVSDELDRVGKLQEIGGFAYLTELVGRVPSSLNVTSYARIIEAHSVRRKMIAKANKIAQLAYDESKPVEEMLHAYDQLVTVDQPASSSLDETQDSDEASLELIEKIVSDIPTGVLSYFPKFDNYEALGGFPIGATLLIGDTSFGKSTVCLQICEQNAMAGNVALYIGPESTNAQMVIRRVAGLSGVDNASKKIRSASMTKAEKSSLVSAITNNYQGKYNGNLKFNSKATTVKKVEAAIRKHRPKICVIDQITQITDATSTNPTLNLLENFARLKAVANKYDCAMIIVHAIDAEDSKEFFKQHEKSLAIQKKDPSNSNPLKNLPPNINSIPWAKQMRHLADVILFLLPNVNCKLSGVDVVEIIIWILKDRDGGRFIDSWFDSDLKAQWFTDKDAPYKAQAQRPSNPAMQQVTATFYQDNAEPELIDINFEGAQ